MNVKTKDNDSMLKAVAYCRFSSEMQRDESIDAQLAAIREYATRNNMTLIHEYIDRAKSATTDQRPAFLQMIKDSGKDKFDVIIIHKLDRFSRDKYDSVVYKRKLRLNNIQLHSVTEHLDGSPESIILESLLEGMAEYYSKNLARETMKGLTENAKKGLSTGGKPPLGFIRNPETKKLEIHEHEAECVRLVFEMVLEGYSYRDVIVELNERGHKTRGGRPFAVNSIYSLLRNEKYRGCFTFNRSQKKEMRGRQGAHKYKNDEEMIRVEGGCPRIVSDEDFFAVQRKMDTRQ